ncbi:FkbM family methyltransferase [Diplocloster hominis]|uniref:FkbM family methyltransferase n=1 Tax=Diplocloster hominis TaxID=3079010 RepID=UPI0031BA7456
MDLKELKEYMKLDINTILKNALINYFCISDKERDSYTLEELSDEYNTEENIELTHDLDYFKSSIIDIKENFSKYEWVYNRLDDFKSKEIFLNLLNAKVLMDSELVEKSYMDSQIYFSSDLFGKLFNESYVDCGAYNGDSIIDFILKCPDYKKVYAFEPSAENIKKLKLNLDSLLNDDSILIYNYAVYNRNTELYFDDRQDDGDKIIEVGDIKVNAIKLDDIINDEVTFIKMDIEGSEKEAVEGAENIIKKYTPKMAICIYHKPNDFWSIMEKINEFNVNYKYAIRHYSLESYSETVLYCIPQKRNEMECQPLNILNVNIIEQRKNLALKVAYGFMNSNYDLLLRYTNYHKWLLKLLRYKINDIKILKKWIDELDGSRDYLKKLADEREEVVQEKEKTIKYLENLIREQSEINAVQNDKIKIMEDQLNNEKNLNSKLNYKLDKLLGDKWIQKILKIKKIDV